MTEKVYRPVPADAAADTRRFLGVALFLGMMVASGCPRPTPSPEPTPAPPERLRITNACAYDLWIQQDQMPAGTPKVTYLKAGASLGYDIPAEGRASTRFWPKKGCDAPDAGATAGENCTIGQSSAPCPKPAGCAPPVDSKIEATWGCTLADKNKCGKTPQGIPMIDTYWNASGVDGFTFPYTITIHGGDKRESCAPVDCSGLSLAACPTDDNLSNDGKNPTYAQVDETVITTLGPNGKVVGCFSPCTALNYPGWGGLGLNDPAGAVEQMYCCPTPPISSPACQGGPVPETKYVKLIHTACKKTAYGYAYDDGLGGRNCSADAVLEMTIGPNCP